MWRYQQEIGTQECHQRAILQMMPRGSNSKPTLMPFSRNRATRWPLKHLKAFRSLLSVLKWGDWVSTESTVHSCLKSQANKTPLVEGPEAEWIQQTFSFKETGSANARLDLPLFQQQMEKKKVCGEWLSRCQLSCFALSAVSHFKFWFCLIYMYIVYVC